MTPDGRLAEQLAAIPDGRLLDLTGVRFVITDKQRDLWAGDVYYDLEQRATVAGRGQSLDLDLAGYPAFPATALASLRHRGDSLGAGGDRGASHARRLGTSPQLYARASAAAPGDAPPAAGGPAAFRRQARPPSVTLATRALRR